jgi:GT2 family glycosyltransferase
VLYPTWWQDVEKLFAEHPNLGGFNPHSFINKKHTGDRVAQYEDKPEYTEEDLAKMREIFHSERWYVGCCTYFTICKKAMFDKIGLFDESFGLGSGEDYDLCIRAARGGFQVCGGSVVMVRHWWGATKDNMPKDANFKSNYDLIAGGNQNMERKWGPHIDKIPGGWSVSGTGGPEEPLDKDQVNYPNKQWFQIVDL